VCQLHAPAAIPPGKELLEPAHFRNAIVILHYHIGVFNSALRHDGVWGTGCIAAYVHILFMQVT
jgi:hypothetical protein